MIDQAQGARLTAAEIKVIQNALGERDEEAAICRDRNGKPEPDAELRDTETVPLKESIDDYFRREVLPHVADAWIDHKKTKTGYEIPFNRHFYRYEPPRPLVEIEADIRKLEAEILSLLSERERQSALISRAVTRGLPPEAARAAGLNPHPKLKPSGIHWLGQIPEHWDIKPLKYLCSMRSGENITSDLISEDAEYPVYGGNGLRGYTDRFTHEGLYVLVGRQGALCGNINYAEGRFWATEHAVVVTCDREVDVHWLGELLRSMNLNQHSVTAAQPGLAVEQIQSLRVPAPPYREQCAISHHLRGETARVDAMVAKVEEAIGRLQEYRTALITTAVTGKINVCEAIPISEPAALVAAG